jgi:hypothetical protein
LTSTSGTVGPTPVPTSQNAGAALGTTMGQPAGTQVP